MLNHLVPGEERVDTISMGPKGCFLLVILSGKCDQQVSLGVHAVG